MLDKRMFLWLAVMFSGIFLHAEAPKIAYDWADEAVNVKPTGIWEKVISPGVKNNSGTPPGLLAYTVSENNTLFNWKPSADESRVSAAADISGVTPSLDESLLIIAENVGGSGQPNSTRLIFVNLINNKICGGMTLEKRRISKLIQIPGMSNRILAVQVGQSAFQNRSALLMIDLKRKKIIQAGPGFDQVISSVCTDGSKAWASFENNNSFVEVDLDDPNREPRYCDSKKTVSALSYNPTSKNVIACGEGICEFFSIQRNSLFLESSIALPEKFIPVWYMTLPHISNGILLQDKEGKGLFVSSGGVVPLADRLEPYGCVLSDHTVLTGISERARINNITLPDCSVKRYFAPSSLRPLNRNKTIFLFARSAKLPETILVDSRGNVFKFTLTGRRGKKSTVLLVDKTGVR